MAYATDHAVLRYIERVMNIDVEAIRAKLACPAVDTAADFGCETVLAHDCKLKLQGDVVATVVVRKTKRDKSNGEC